MWVFLDSTMCVEFRKETLLLMCDAGEGNFEWVWFGGIVR